MENKQNENGLQPENVNQPEQETVVEETTAQEPAAEETSAVEVKEPVKTAKKKGAVKTVLGSNKFKRGGMSTIMTVVFIAIIVVINILVSLVTERFPSLNIDLTAQKVNTLSDQALDVAKSVELETEIYLIGSEEAYRKNQNVYYSSYGIELGQVANLAEKLQEANSKISMDFIDPDTNPTFISEYPDETLTTGAVLVRTEKRYKVVSIGDLFSVQSNSSTGATETYSKVDSALAAAIEVVNMDKVPVLTIATGHDEMLTTSTLSSFISLMEKDNFEIKEIDLLTEEIPEDTQLLMIPTPSTDYTEEEINKLREYLDDEERSEDISLLVTAHTTQTELPHLASFLEEWGISVGEGMVAETDSSRIALRNASYVLVDAAEDVISENSYSNIIAPQSRPVNVLFSSSGDVVTQALWSTADTAYVVTEDMTETDDPDTAQQNVAAIATRSVKIDKSYKTRTVMVFGSSWIFTDTFIGASAFGNKSYISDLVKYATGTDGSTVSVYTQSVQTNTLDITASAGTLNLLGLGVFTIGLPLVILIAGFVIFLKRRHL